MLSETVTLRSQLNTVIDELEGSGALEAVLRYARAIRQGEVLDQDEGKAEDEENDNGVTVSVLVNGELREGRMGMISPSDNYIKVDLGEQKFTFSEVASRNPVISEVFQQAPTLLNINQMAMAIHYCCTDREAIARGGNSLKDMLLKFSKELCNYSGAPYETRRSYIDVFLEAYPEEKDSLDEMIKNELPEGISFPNRADLIESQKSSIPRIYTISAENRDRIDILIWNSAFSIYDAIMSNLDNKKVLDLMLKDIENITSLSEDSPYKSDLESEILKRLPYVGRLKFLRILQEDQDEEDDYRSYRLQPEKNRTLCSGGVYGIERTERDYEGGWQFDYPYED